MARPRSATSLPDRDPRAGIFDREPRFGWVRGGAPVRVGQWGFGGAAPSPLWLKGVGGVAPSRHLAVGT